jgi:aminoglycoside phosphotransferase (APT) family kinase protein
MSSSGSPQGAAPAALRSQAGVADEGDVLRRASLAAARPLSQLTVLTGGTSSLTYSALNASGERVVAKVAPPGLAPVRNRDVLRQARLLAALSAAPGVAVPAVLGSEPGSPPEVPPLFVMSFEPGESYEPLHAGEAPRPPAQQVLLRARAAARMLAALHDVSPTELGLDEEPLPLEAEMARWRKAFSTCELSPALQADETACYELLAAAIPAPVASAVLHGDWRLGNMQCEGPAVRAVIDWEIWSIGDPRTDLAWFRLMADRSHPNATAADAPMLAPDELREEYEDACGAAVTSLRWFDALVRYKQAAASALLVKNAERRGESGVQIERMRLGIGLLLLAALDLLAPAA